MKMLPLINFQGIYISVALAEKLVEFGLWHGVKL
jgi:hypothetical protein